MSLIDQSWNDRKCVSFGVKTGQGAKSELFNESLEFMKYAVIKIDDEGYPHIKLTRHRQAVSQKFWTAQAENQNWIAGKNNKRNPVLI